jgi:hypothetical protein
MRYHLFTLAILLVALALYAIGMSGGGFLLLFLGAALELWFWVRAMRGGKRAASTVPHGKA